MFQKAPDSMIPDPTPERVFALCRLIARRSMSRDELRNAMSLGKASSSSYSEFQSALSVAAEDLGVLHYADDKLVLAIAPEHLASPTAFRRYAGTRAFRNKDSSFVLFTRWYLAQNERVFALDSWEVKAKTAAQEVPALAGLRENDALGWRLWAAFFGLGYLSAASLIPNANIRLADLFATAFPESFPYDEPVQAADFMPWLAEKMPEADLNGVWPMAVSAGLRTLDELGRIRLEARQDTHRISLFFVDGEPVNEFSHITVREEGCP